MSVHVESVGRGRPLVMLHGWAMHSGLWFPLLPRLIERYRMHLVDLPGHGYSDALVAPPALSLAPRRRSGGARDRRNVGAGTAHDPGLVARRSGRARMGAVAA